MPKKTNLLLGLMVFLAAPPLSWGQDIIELDTTTIQGNTELPKYMYVVPWQNSKSRSEAQRKLKLHNLYGDLFDPVMPKQMVEAEPAMPATSAKQ